jgi:hypothetical protein
MDVAKANPINVPSMVNVSLVRVHVHQILQAEMVVQLTIQLSVSLENVWLIKLVVHRPTCALLLPLCDVPTESVFPATQNALLIPVVPLELSSAQMEAAKQRTMTVRH